MNVVIAAVAYWAIIFALGFMIGTVRVLWLAPTLGLLPATALELPMILMASWWSAKRLVRRFGVSTRSGALAMGLLAFALLMLAECALAVALLEQSPADWLTNLRQPHALLGLFGQALFGLMPWLVARKGISAVGT